MKKYILYNAQGEIVQTGSCPADDLQLQFQEGLFLIEGEADCAADSVDPGTGEIIKGGRQASPAQVTPPTVGSMPVDVKLDLLWQAMDSGTFPKAEPFYSAIKAQKGLS